MRIVVSKAYQKWKKTNKSNRVSDVVDKFLGRVAVATDTTQILPQPKTVGNNLRKSTGTVNEFTLTRQIRVYSKYVELTPGVVSFCLATVGIKGNTNQHEDILASLAIFDNVDATEWEELQMSDTPSNAMPDATPDVDDSHVDEPGADVPDSGDVMPAPKKKKGKPVDENGLTAAERKALRKKQKQEEEQKKRMEERKKFKQIETQNVAPVADAAPKQTDAAPNVPALDLEPKPVKPVATAPVMQDVRPNVVDAKSHDDNAPKPAVTLNGEPIANPEPVTGDVKFKEMADLHYCLELIDHQIKIEQMKIRMLQHEIALEELAIKKMQLLHMQKNKGLEK